MDTVIPGKKLSTEPGHCLISWMYSINDYYMMLMVCNTSVKWNADAAFCTPLASYLAIWELEEAVGNLAEALHLSYRQPWETLV